MGTNYNGDGTIPAATAPTPIAIVSSTNATPIVVTTGTHGYATGDTVGIEGHATNTNANGLWVVTVLTSTTFSLNGSTGNGVGGATGLAIDYAVNPLWVLPSGGDLRTASSVSSPLEAAANLAPYLYERAGAYRIISQLNLGGGSNVALLSTTSVGTSFVSLQNLTDILGTSTTGGRYLISGDILNLTFASTHDSTAFPSGCNIGFGIKLGGASDAPITESAIFTDTSGLSNVFLPFALTESYVYSGSSTGISYSLSIMAISASGTHTLDLWGRYQLTCTHLRPNT